MSVNYNLNGQDSYWVPTSFNRVEVGQLIKIRYRPRGKPKRKEHQRDWNGEINKKQKEMIIVNGIPIRKNEIVEIWFKKDITSSKVPYTPEEARLKVVRYLVQHNPCKASLLSRYVKGSLDPLTIGLDLRKNPYVRNTRQGWIVIDRVALLNDGVE